jgi:hypothetical protein
VAVHPEQSLIGLNLLKSLERVNGIEPSVDAAFPSNGWLQNKSFPARAVSMS